MLKVDVSCLCAVVLGNYKVILFRHWILAFDSFSSSVLTPFSSSVLTLNLRLHVGLCVAHFDLDRYTAKL